MWLRNCIGSLRSDDMDLKKRNISQLQKELCRRIKIINEHEERMLELWEIENQNIGRKLRAKAQEQRDLMNYLKQMKRSLQLVKEQQMILLKQLVISKRQMEVRAEVKDLALKNMSIERKCYIFWETTYHRHCEPDKKRREWREKLRHTRSDSDINKAILRASLVRWHGRLNLTNA